MATKSAYTAATTAASVGVNTPIFRPTSTITGSISAQVDSLSARQRSAALALGGGVTFSRRATKCQVTAMATPMSRPGTMPARNSLPMETLPATPKMMKAMEGGITGAMTPADAMRPPARPLSWPALTIMGSSSAASAAVSATAEPESAAMRQPASTATYPRPPRRWPTSASARFTMRCDRPPTFMISPASMKKGTASSGKLSAPLMTFCARI